MFTTLRLNCKTFLIIWPGDRVCNGVRWQPKPGPSLWIVGDRVLCSLMFHVKTMVRGLLWSWLEYLWIQWLSCFIELQETRALTLVWVELDLRHLSPLSALKILVWKMVWTQVLWLSDRGPLLPSLFPQAAISSSPPWPAVVAVQLCSLTDLYCPSSFYIFAFRSSCSIILTFLFMGKALSLLCV